MFMIPVILEILNHNHNDIDNDIDYINMTVDVYETSRLSINTKENINELCQNKEFKNNFLNFWNNVRKKKDEDKNDILDRLEKEINILFQ